MELWIRSQDRKELYMIKDKLYLAKGSLVQTSIAPYEIEQHYEVRCRFGDDILGEYKSESRALEVLDEIQSKIKPLLYLKPKALLKPEDLIGAKKYFEELNEQEFITCDKHFEIIPFSSNIVVYNMPKE